MADRTYACVWAKYVCLCLERCHLALLPFPQECRNNRTSPLYDLQCLRRIYNPETDPQELRRLYSDPTGAHFARLRPDITTSERAGSWKVLHWTAVLVMEIEGHRANVGPRARVASCSTRYLAREAQELACTALARQNPPSRSAAFPKPISWSPRNARDFHGVGISTVSLK